MDLPIIKYSVNWWNTLHQPASITLTGAPTISGSLLWPLGLSTLGITLGFWAIVVARLRAAVMERRIRGLLSARAAARMTHLPYVIGSYMLFALLALGLVVSTSLRLRLAARRLRAIDPRAQDLP